MLKCCLGLETYKQQQMSPPQNGGGGGIFALYALSRDAPFY